MADWAATAWTLWGKLQGRYLSAAKRRRHLGTDQYARRNPDDAIGPAAAMAIPGDRSADLLSPHGTQ